jgi:signal transduction histidine kinase
MSTTALSPGQTAASAPHVLQRETFQTSRLLDFCTERELVKQIVHSTDQWPLVVLKELTDNALDAAEEAGTAPVIRIEVSDKHIVITDNGPGIPAETLAGILDFLVRSLPGKPTPRRPEARRAMPEG